MNLEQFTNLITNVSFLIGIWVAIYGISSWRKEYKGKREIELAEDTLALFYEAVDAIKHMRAPISFSFETESVERNDNESDEAWEARKNASVVFKRYNDHKELFNKIYAMRYRFMAQIGKEQAIPFDDLKSIVNKIFSSARILARLWTEKHSIGEEMWNQHINRIRKYEAVFCEGAEVEDPINQELDTMVTNIENTCRKVIIRKNTLYSVLKNKICASPHLSTETGVI
jgi:metal-dependent HD superfamily phosphatase/phosphodiesterase